MPDRKKWFSSLFTGSVNSPFEDISLDEDDLEGTGLEEGNRGAARSELKRQREKNRRKAITNAYGELASFIVQLDPELGEIDLQMNKKRRKSGDGDKTSGISQVNVVGLALKLMKRLHSENEDNKRILKAMQEREVQDFNSENVFVMVPTLNPVDNDNGFTTPRGLYPSYSNTSPVYYRSRPQNTPEYDMVALRNQRQPYRHQTNNVGQKYLGPRMSHLFYPQGVQYH